MFKNARDFENMRSLRNEDGTCMRLYYRKTKQRGSFLSAVYATSEGLLRRARQLDVKHLIHWVQPKKDSSAV